MKALMELRYNEVPKISIRLIISFFIFMAGACLVTAIIFIIYRILTYKVFARKVTANITDAERQVLPTGQKMARFTCSYTFDGKNYCSKTEMFDDDADAKDEVEIWIDARKPQKILNYRNKIISTTGLFIILILTAILFFTMFQTAFDHFSRIYFF